MTKEDCMKKKLIIATALTILSISSASAESYYVFGLAEDDCILKSAPTSNRKQILGEACACIHKSDESEEQQWRIDWSKPACISSSLKEGFHSKSNHSQKEQRYTQIGCLRVLFDTQWTNPVPLVSKHTCLVNNTVILPDTGFEKPPLS